MTLPIRYFKLFTGEDIVASVVDDKKYHITVTHPLLIKQIFDPVTNTIYSGFHSWVPLRSFLPCKFDLMKGHIVAMISVPEDVMNSYLEYIRDPSPKINMKSEDGEEIREYDDESDDNEIEKIVDKKTKQTYH